MNKQAICEKISAWFEPIESLPVLLDDSIETRLSPKGYWLQVSIWSEGDVPRWEAMDYFHSEDANARLLEAAKLTVSPYGPVGWHAFVATHWFAGKTAGGGQGEYWGIRTGDHVDSIVYENHADRKTAVVLAFCKFAGIEIQ